MLKLVLSAALALLLLFAVSLAVIRAQPYEPGALRAFIEGQPDCPMPCFLGIRPGVTSADDAVRLLESHPWIAEVAPAPSAPDVILWRWSGAQPPLFDNATGGSLVRNRDNRIESIRVRTRMPYALAWFELDMRRRGYPLPKYSRAIYGLQYWQPVRYVLYFVACPAHYQAFWSEHIVLDYGDDFIALTDARIRADRRIRLCY